MKMRFTAITLLLFSAVCSASAAPVLYSFSYTGSPSGIGYLSFQYLAPSYITGSSPLLSSTSLSNISIDPSFSLSTVVLAQENFPTYTGVDVQTTLLEKFDFNQPIILDFTFLNGPNGPNVFLDRDGTYTQNSGSGLTTLSVRATPEPSTASLLLLTAPVAWLYRRKRRIQR